MITVPEAATTARCCTKTIYQQIHLYQAKKHLAKKPGLPASKPAGKWLIKESDLAKWMEGK